MQQTEEVLIQNYMSHPVKPSICSNAHTWCSFAASLAPVKNQYKMNYRRPSGLLVSLPAQHVRLVKMTVWKEQDGREYYFFSRAPAIEKIERKEYFEVALVHGQINGATVQEIQRIHDAGKTAIGDVDYQGIQYYKKHSPTTLALFLCRRVLQCGWNGSSVVYDTEAEFIAAWPKRRDSAIHELEWARQTCVVLWSTMTCRKRLESSGVLSMATRPVLVVGPRHTRSSTR